MFFFAELFILPNIRQTIIFLFHQNRFDPAQLLASRIHPLMQFYLKYSASHLEGVVLFHVIRCYVVAAPLAINERSQAEKLSTLPIS